MTAGLAIYDTVSVKACQSGGFELTRYRCRFVSRSKVFRKENIHSVDCQYVSSPIHTYCVGQACSMGSMLLAAGPFLKPKVLGS